MKPAARVGELISGRYRIDSVIGSGNMGIVCAAWDLELERRVAIKCVRASVADADGGAARFQREARALAKIESEHVGRLLDIGYLEDRRPFMVMEFLEGHDLESELDKRRVLPISVAVDYVLQTIEAVALAHAAGIVHRDLKPANLFLARRADGSQIVKVLDFGISKWINQNPTDLRLTQSGSVVGSPLYMAPEQLDSPKDVGVKADIWALGTILFEMLAGRPPFLCRSFEELVRALLTTTPPPLGSLVPNIPPALEACVQICLRRRPETRHETVAELARGLSPFAPPHALIHVERASRVLSAGLKSPGPAGERTLVEPEPLLSESASLLKPPELAPQEPAPIDDAKDSAWRLAQGVREQDPHALFATTSTSSGSAPPGSSVDAVPIRIEDAVAPGGGEHPAAIPGTSRQRRRRLGMWGAVGALAGGALMVAAYVRSRPASEGAGATASDLPNTGAAVTSPSPEHAIGSLEPRSSDQRQGAPSDPVATGVVSTGGSPSTLGDRERATAGGTTGSPGTTDRPSLLTQPGPSANDNGAKSLARPQIPPSKKQPPSKSSALPDFGGRR